MKEKEKFDFILEDRRVMEKRLRRHKLSQPEYQKYLKSLADDAERGIEQVVFRETQKDS